MKAVQLHFVLFLLVTAAAAAAAQISAPELSKEDGIDARHRKVEDDIHQASDGTQPGIDRLKRQTDTETTPTPKPKKPRPSNLFSLFSVLLTETREDANRAFGEIGTLFNSQFSNATTPRTTTTTTTTDSSSSSSTEGDEDNEITTTTEQFRISRDEFFGVLRSNVQGIVNLFGKEFRVAIRDSNQNVREFGRDLGLALRPYFYNTGNSTTKNNTKSSS